MTYSSKNMLGKIFDRLIVINKSDEKDSSRILYWLCQCECGTIKSIRGDGLRKGSVRSCGCLQKEVVASIGSINILGSKFGRLTVIEKTNKRLNRNIIWKCQCDCGNFCYVSSRSLRKNKTKSCKCYQKDLLKQNLSGEKHFNWRGGSSKLKNKYPTEWTEELRESIRNRDLRKCQFPNCEYDDTKEQPKLSVHHINSDKNNCDPSNLISLCLRHHMIIEHNVRYWESYFYNIIKDYTYEE